jgi:Protein of unknown function (DUF2924)
MPSSALDREAIEAEIDRVRSLGLDELRTLWRATFRSPPPLAFAKDLIARFLCWHIQEQAVGELDPETAKHLDGLVRRDKAEANRPRRVKPGTVLVREYQGDRHTVTVVPNGYVWHETTYASLSVIARAITGTAWNGPRFFGLRSGGKPAVSSVVADGSPAAPVGRAPGRVTKTKPQLAVAARGPDGNLSLAASSLGDGERRP